MKERPILFSDAMVRAILSGAKTQTRRVVNPYPPAQRSIIPYLPSAIVDQQDGTFAAYTDGRKFKEFRCPYGMAGERLWVREAHAIVPRTAYRASTGVHQVLRPDDDHDAAVFRADWERSAPSRWRPSIHMPRWACRILLEIVSVRIERLQDISEADAEAEGCAAVAPVQWFEGLKPMADGSRVRQECRGEPPPDWTQIRPLSSHDPLACTARDAFRRLWYSINGAESWSANPWVWCIEFRRAQP